MCATVFCNIMTTFIHRYNDAQWCEQLLQTTVECSLVCINVRSYGITRMYIVAVGIYHKLKLLHTVQMCSLDVTPFHDLLFIYYACRSSTCKLHFTIN